MGESAAAASQVEWKVGQLVAVGTAAGVDWEMVVRPDRGAVHWSISATGEPMLGDVDVSGHEATEDKAKRVAQEALTRVLRHLVRVTLVAMPALARTP